MICALSNSNKELLYKLVYLKAKEFAKSGKPFDLKKITKNIYDEVFSSFNDHELALAYVANVPNYTALLYGTESLRDSILPVLAEARSLEKEFLKSYTKIEKFLGLKNVSVKEIKDKIIEHNENISLPGNESDEPVIIQPDRRSRPLRGTATTGLQQVFVLKGENNENGRFPDPSKQLQYDIISDVARQILDKSTSDKIKIGEQTGIYLRPVSISEIPEDSLWPEFKNPAMLAQMKEQGKQTDVVVALCDVYGNLLRFDNNKKTTYGNDGKVVFQMLRTAIKKNGEYDIDNDTLAAIDQEVDGIERAQEVLFESTPDGLKERELFRQKMRSEVRERRRNEYKQIDEIIENVKTNKDQRFVHEIDGGSLGVNPTTYKDYTPLNKTNITTQHLNKVYVVKEGSSETMGRMFLEINHGTFLIDRIKMNPEFAGVIADILTKVLSGMNTQEKYDFFNNYIDNKGNPTRTKTKNDKTESNNFNLKLKSHGKPLNFKLGQNENPFILSLNGVDIELPDYDSADTEQVRNTIVDTLLTKGAGNGPFRLQYDQELVGKTIKDIKINGSKIDSTNIPYSQWIKDNADIQAFINPNTGLPFLLNAHLNIGDSVNKDRLEDYPMSESSKKVVSEDEQGIPDISTKTDTVDDSTFFKRKSISNFATEEQIKKAKSWFDSNSISKHINFEELFNVVNSNAFAQWNKSGITLFAGANYTDLYHESWHAFTQLFLSKGDKGKLYNEARGLSGIFKTFRGETKKFSDATNLEIEEFLAEDFRQYALSNGTKIINGRSSRNNIFRNIWNYLKAVFSGVSPKEVITNHNSIGKIKEIYDKLYFGQINEYNPSFTNNLFDTLNHIKPIDERWSQFDLGYERSVLISNTLDSLISDFINGKNEFTGGNYTVNIFLSKNLLSQAYKYSLNRINKKINELDPVNDKDKLVLLNFIKDNIGDLDNFDKNAESIIGFHQEYSKFLKEVKFIDDEQDVEGSERVGDAKSGNSQSIKEMADSQVLSVLWSLHKKNSLKLNTKGEAEDVTNELGFTELANFKDTWNSLVKNASGILDYNEFYARITDSKLVSSNPVFKELAQKLGAPSGPGSIVSSEQFLLQMKFSQTFNKSYSPISKLMVNKDGEKYNLMYGNTSLDVKNAKNRLSTEFNTRPADRYTIKDKNNRNRLNIPNILIDFNSKGKLDSNKTQDFLKAIGITFDTNAETVKGLREMTDISWLYSFLKLVNEYNSNNPEKQLLIYDPIKTLEDPHSQFAYTLGEEASDILKANKISSQSGIIKNVLQFYTHTNNLYSGLPSYTAENEMAFNDTINSTLTNVFKKLNLAKNYSELIVMPGMTHFDMERNPHMRAAKVLNELFYMDIDKTNELYGTKREGSYLQLDTLVGTELQENEEFKQGILTSGADKVTKITSDVHMMLLYNKMELMRHGSKGTAQSFFHKLYVPLTQVRSNQFDYTFKQVIPYLYAELERINKFTQEIDSYKNAAGYNRVVKKEDGSSVLAGEVFTMFDGILKTDIKEKLYKLTPAEVENNPGLLSDIKSEMEDYFSKLTEQTLGLVNEMPVVFNELQQKMFKEAGIQLNPEEDPEIDKIQRKFISRAFTLNNWIYNAEQISFIYGDLAQYNHAKEEFHKRNSAVASTGNQFDVGSSSIHYVNSSLKRPYREKLLNDSGVPFNGVANTAIIQDMEIASAMSDHLETLFRNDLISQGIKGEQLDKQLSKIMKSYKKMTEGDGQGYVSFDFYRIMRNLEGNWGPVEENLFQKIVNNDHVDPSELKTYFPVYKVQGSGPLNNSVVSGGLPLQAFHKFSLAPLIPTVIKGKQLELVHKMMMDQNVDYILFDSGSKVGSIRNNKEADDLYKKDRTINTDLKFTVNELHMSYLKNQQDVNDWYKGKTIFSTQLRALLTEGLFQNGKAINPTAEKLANRFNSLVDQLMDLKMKDIVKEIGWKKENGKYIGPVDNLVKLIKEELSARDFAENQMEGIKISNGQPVFDLSFIQDIEKVEKTLAAIINNRLIRQKMTGEALVQMATSMMEDVNKLTNPTDAQKELYKFSTNDAVSYIPDLKREKNTTAMKVKVALQGNFKNILNAVHSDGEQIRTIERLNSLLKDEEWLDKDNNRKLITMVGVRIPVQGLNSMEFMEVFEFLPEEAGNIIITPSEIVAKSGGDFDIDKLTVFMPTIYKSGSYATREFDSVEKIDSEIEKLKSKPSEIVEAETLLKELSTKENKLDRKVRREKIKKFFELKNKLSAEKRELIEEIEFVLPYITNKRFVNEFTQASYSDKFKVLNIHAKNLDKIDPTGALSDIQKDLVKLRIDKIEQQEMFNLVNSNNEEREYIATLHDKLQPLRTRISELKEQKKKFNNTVENEIIESIREILELPENAVQLLTPNDTYILKEIADDLSKHVVDYNAKKDVKSGETGTMSPTRVLEYPYNVAKHEANIIGKEALGIAAVMNKFSTILNHVGGYLGTSYKVWDSTVPLKIYLEHNKTTDGNVSLSHLKDVNNQHKISELISQAMNGLVDIEKDAWISYIQGNPEILPTLSMMLVAGVPVKQACWFVSQPMVREYAKQLRIAKGPLAPLFDTGNSTSIKTTAREAVLNKFSIQLPNLSAPKLSKADEPETVEAAINMFNTAETLERKASVLAYMTFKNWMTKDQAKMLYKTESSFDGNISFETIEKVIKTNDTSSDNAEALFFHFLQLEDTFSGMNELRAATNFDTEKSSTLHQAQIRINELNELSESGKVPKDIVDKIIKDTILGSFAKSQNFMLDLWGTVIKFRTHPDILSYSENALNEYRQSLRKAYGDDESFLKAFKTELVSYLYQNYLKGFNVSNKNYKGYKMTEAIPVKYIEQLKQGVYVQDGNVYIDQKQLNKDFEDKVFTPGSSSVNSYKKRGLAPVGAQFFAGSNKDDYFHFVVEREYLRSITPADEFNSSEKYEEHLRDQALINTFNYYTLFSNKSENSLGEQYIKILKIPGLKDKFSVLEQIEVQEIMNGKYLVAKNTKLDKDEIQGFAEQVKNLSKHSNPEVSNFFRNLPMYAYLQSGLNNSKYNITAILDPINFLNVITLASDEFTKKILNAWIPVTSNDKLLKYENAILRKRKFYITKKGTAYKVKGDQILKNPNFAELVIFKNKFAQASQKYTTRKGFKNYTIGRDNTLSVEKVLELNPTVADNIFTFKPNTGDLGMEELKATAQKYPDTIFVTRKPIGGVTNNVVFTPGKNLEESKVKIEELIKELEFILANGLSIAFTESGISVPTSVKPSVLDNEVFTYTSKRLYEEFRYLNPGAINKPEIAEKVKENNPVIKPVKNNTDNSLTVEEMSTAITNLASKHNMSKEEAERSIKHHLAKDPQNALEKIRTCYL